MSAKRVIKATVEVIERQNLKMLFVVDDLKKALEELSPGKTIGKDGEDVALQVTYVVGATDHLQKALKMYRLALELYNKKTEG